MLQILHQVYKSFFCIHLKLHLCHISCIFFDNVMKDSKWIIYIQDLWVSFISIRISSTLLAFIYSSNSAVLQEQIIVNKLSFSEPLSSQIPTDLKLLVASLLLIICSTIWRSRVGFILLLCLFILNLIIKFETFYLYFVDFGSFLIRILELLQFKIEIE